MKDELIMPNYGNSILNLINSILRHYNIKTKYKGLNQLEKYLQKDYKNIVLIVLDGMGYNILKDHSPNGFFMEKNISKITSVCPSTTTAAMTTYYSGKPPIETGWIAMSQYYKEHGRQIETLRERYTHTHEEVNNERFDIIKLMEYKTVYEQIEEMGVKAYEINPDHCKSRSKRNINAKTVELMCDNIKDLCTNNDKKFILAYNDNPDVLLHKNGCNSKEVNEFIKIAEEQIKKLAKDLKDTNTLILVSADHGHKEIGKVYNILEMEDIQECMIMPPAFESRAVTFWVKENKREKFEEIFNKKFKEEFMLFTKEEFLEKKLLGEGNQHKKIDDFIGNYIAIAISDAIIKLDSNLAPLKGNKKATHCGFTKYEMEVPLIVIEC